MTEAEYKEMDARVEKFYNAKREVNIIFEIKNNLQKAHAIKLEPWDNYYFYNSQDMFDSEIVDTVKEMVVKKLDKRLDELYEEMNNA